MRHGFVVLSCPNILLTGAYLVHLLANLLHDVLLCSLLLLYISRRNAGGKVNYAVLSYKHIGKNSFVVITWLQDCSSTQPVRLHKNHNYIPSDSRIGQTFNDRLILLRNSNVLCRQNNSPVLFYWMAVSKRIPSLHPRVNQHHSGLYTSHFSNTFLTINREEHTERLQ